MGQLSLKATKGLLLTLEDLPFEIVGKILNKQVMGGRGKDTLPCGIVVLMLTRTVFRVSWVIPRYHSFPVPSFSVLDPNIYFISLHPSIICLFIDRISQDLLTGCALHLPDNGTLDF